MGQPRCGAGRFPAIRSGLSLTEVLVAIGILALLMALLLPAVQSSREASRRIVCSSHVRQVMLAAQNYEATYGVYPGACAFNSWPRRILSYLETPEDADRCPMYICPSDPDSIGKWGGGKSYMSFQPCEGLGSSADDGYIVQGRCIGARDITDGLSQTACYAERLAMPHLHSSDMLPAADFRYLWHRRIRKTPLFLTDFDVMAEQCARDAQEPIPFWFGFTGYNHIMTPNGNSCANGPATDSKSYGYFAITASSLHSGGVNVATGDGAVHFVSNSVDRGVWRALGTRAGGEPNAGQALGQ